MSAGIEYVESHMLNRDGDDHKRLRRLVSKAFTPRMIEQLRPRIQEIADDLLDPVVADGEMELVSTFAFPLPITVIAELLGVPAADRDQFREWSDAFVTPALDPDCRRASWSRWRSSSRTSTHFSRRGARSRATTSSARSSRSRTAATRSPRPSSRAWPRS